MRSVPRVQSLEFFAYDAHRVIHSKKKQVWCESSRVFEFAQSEKLIPRLGPRGAHWSADDRGVLSADLRADFFSRQLG